MSRRFSMTSNPVRASESQDEAEPLLGDAEKKCDDVVEAIGFGNWSLLLVILLGFLFMGDSIEATLLDFLYDCVGGAFDLNPFEASTVISMAFGTAGSSTTWVHTTELYSTDIRSTAHTLAFIVGRFGGFASGYVVENANSIPFATIVLIIMAALSALGTLTLRETMGERLS